MIDPPKVYADAVWPVEQYNLTCANSGIQDAYMNIIPRSVLPLPDYVFPASCFVTGSKAAVKINSSGDSSNTVWFARAGSGCFSESVSMTKASGTANSIQSPAGNGEYKLCVVNSEGKKIGESTSLLRVTGGVAVEHISAVSKVQTFITAISRERLIIKSQFGDEKYSVSVFMPNGQLVKRADEIKESYAFPIRAKGLYLVMIKCNGHVQKKTISLNGFVGMFRQYVKLQWRFYT